MGAFNENLHPRGQADNKGKFRNRDNSAPVEHLQPVYAATRHVIEAKRRQLEAEGFVRATSGPASQSPTVPGGTDKWWRDAHLRSSLSVSGDTYQQMPDDYTPGLAPGRALSGRRRTHTKLYQLGEIAVRMPSASAVKRFSDEIGDETFEFPISAEGAAGKPIAGHVRVTRSPSGRWAVEAINMAPAAQGKVAEAVASILEARRPSFALDDVQKMGGLVEKHRQRIIDAGTRLTAVDSTWVRGVGYNDATGELVMDLQGRHYSYKAPKGVYEYVAGATSPGKAYNQLVKGRFPAERVDRCDNCGRVGRLSAAHTCMNHRKPNGRIKAYNERVRAVFDLV